MDTRTGRIFSPDEIKALRKTRPELFGGDHRMIEMNLDPTPRQLARNPARVGRNEPCPCGSGKKFKHCHLRR